MSRMAVSLRALQNGKSLFEVPNLYENYKPGVQRKGYIYKRRGLTGMFSKRYVEVSGGFITWTKPDDVESNTRVSCRKLSGAVVRAASEHARIEKMSSELHVFIIFLAYDMRELDVPPVILAAESEEDMQQWVQTINHASGWLYQPAALVPLPRRLCGLIVIEIISVENVIPRNWGGTSDPYVLVSFNGLFGRTETEYKTLSARYNNFITLPVYNDDPNLTINICVLDEEDYSRDGILGAISLPLHSLGFNKEIVWDSLALRPAKGSAKSKSTGTADPFGVISFRTLYNSSKVTQLLPLKQTPTVDYYHSTTMDGEPSGGQIGTRRDVVAAYTVDLRNSLTQAGLDRASSHSFTENGSEAESPKSQTSSPTKKVTADDSFASPKSRVTQNSANSPPSSPQSLAQSDDEEEYDFTLEMFKAQLVRILAIIKLFSLFKAIGYIISWRAPWWTLTLYVWSSWVCLVEPQSALTFWLVFLGRLILQAHPCYPDLMDEIRTRWYQGWTLKPKIITSQLSSGTSIGSDQRLIEFRVFECQRRRIAAAMKVITTIVSAPAQMALQAGSAAADAVMRNKDEEPSSPSSARHIRQDLGDLFVKFSAKNLKPGEAEWIGPTGATLNDSPSTVIDGMKIKWSVHVQAKQTDKNGWEYSKNFPSIGSSHTGDDIAFDPRAHILWGGGQKFERKFRMHKHWIRRRMWVGTAVRPALSSEEPIRLSQIVETATGDDKDELVGQKHNRSLLARFRQLMEEGKKLQNVLFGIATRLESIKNLVSWKARWISSLVFWVLIVLLFFSLFVSQFIVFWAILSAVLFESLVDSLKLQRLTNPLLHALQEQLTPANACGIPGQWRQLMQIRMKSYSCNMEELLTEVPVSIVCGVFQRACDELWFKNAVLLSLNDFVSNDTYGPLTLQMVLEKIYLAAHHGDADWWKSVKVGIHPKNLIRGHLVSDWELYNPSSVFASQ